jgi:hypothetical protein
MPIRINLLAESQAAEELRRRDPVKRAIYVAVCLVVMVLVWMSSLQVKIMADKAQLNNLEARHNSLTNEYTRILENKKSLQDVHDKLAALNRLAAARFLQATLLDAPMHATVDGIQLLHLRTDHTFENVPEAKAVVEHGKTVSPAKAAGAVERIKLILDAKDVSANPGNEQINKFKQTLAETPYFKTEQISTNNIMLKNLSPPQYDNESGKTYVLFSLECLYPDKSR